MSDGTAVFACARPGGTKHCFGYFVIVSLMLFGLRGLMSHRMALSWWCGEIADHQNDGCSVSDGTGSFACVRPGGFPHCFGCVVAFSQMMDGMCCLCSHRMALSCWCDELRTAMWR